MSACGRRTDNEVSHGTKTEGSEALGFLLLAPRGTKTGLSPSQTEGRRESAVAPNAPPGRPNGYLLSSSPFAASPGTAPNALLHSQFSPSCKPDRLVQVYTQLELYLEV